MKNENIKSHYLYPGSLFANKTPHLVTTILGSCVAVCLWDSIVKIGGINHYNLPLWNGECLASPKYGNIAINKLITKMLRLGSIKKNMQAKVFGGATVLELATESLKIGERNIVIAQDALKDEGITVVSSSVGGLHGRKLKFYTDTGVVMLKFVRKII